MVSPFNGFYGRMEIYYGAFCLCGIFRLIEPLSAIWIEIADIFFFRILDTAIKPGHRII